MFPSITARSSSIPAVQESLLASTAAGVEDDLLAANKLREWGAKSAHSLLDQGLTALTGFCMSLLLARWMAPEVYGAYAIAFAGYLFVGGFHNVMVLEPMSVIGPARHVGKLTDYLRSQIAVHTVLSGLLSAVVMTAGFFVWLIEPQSPLVGAIVGSGLAVPFILFLCLARRVCYVLRRPFVAILGSGSCLAFVLLGLYLLHHFGSLHPLSAFLLMGCGSLLGSYLVLRELEIGLPGNSGEHGSWKLVLKENWAYGRWLAGSTVLYSTVGQVQMFLTASFLGLGASGILRATLLPASVMTQIVTAAGLLVLPGFAFDFGRGWVERIRRKAVLVSGVLGGAGVCFVALLALAAGRVEHLLFNGKYGDYTALMPILALIPAANGFAMGYSTALRATQRPHFDLLANAIAAPIAVISALLFIHWWGLAGAAVSMVSGFAVSMAVNCWIFYTSLQPCYSAVTEQVVAANGVRE